MFFIIDDMMFPSVIFRVTVTNETTKSGINTSDSNQLSTSGKLDAYYIGVYGGIIASTLVAASVQTCLFAITLTLSSKRVHDLMFAALLRLQMKFFDTNPSGKVTY